MKRSIILLVAMLALAAGLASTAQAGPWIPGTPTYAEEMDASDLLERTYDHAYCQGIPRFGHRGEFPYEEFVVFECSIDRDDLYCYDVRYKAVKGKTRGWFRLVKIRNGDCI